MIVPRRGHGLVSAVVVLLAVGLTGAAATDSNSTTPAPVAHTQDGAELQPGLVVEQRHFTTGEVAVMAIDKKVDFWSRGLPRIATRWSGKLQIKKQGNYTFMLEVEGGAKLEIDSAQIIGLGANGTTGLQINSGHSVLSAGYHTVVITYQEVSGEAGVILKYSGPDTGHALQVVAPDVLWHVKGPCDLTGLPKVATMPCSGRWALASGEQCLATCQAGYFAIQRPGGNEGTTGSYVTCLAGEITPKEVCASLYCSPPSVPNAPTAHCLEGPAIPHGAECTPVCPDGQLPGLEGPLACDNGTLSGTWYDCHEARPCTLSAESIPRSKLVPCAGLGAGMSVPSGQKCIAQCEEGYAASGDPLCTDGRFPTKSATSPPFECESAEATTSTMSPSTTTSTEALKTALTSKTEAGSVVLHVSSVAGFAVGDTIRIGAPPGDDEWNTISSFGSIILETPLDNSYAAGTQVYKASAAAARRRRNRRRFTTTLLPSESTTNLIQHWEDSVEDEINDGPPWRLLLVVGSFLLCCALCCIAVTRLWVARQKSTVRLARRADSKDVLLDSEDSEDEEHEAAPPPSTTELPPSDKERILSASWKPTPKVVTRPGSAHYGGPYRVNDHGAAWSDVALLGGVGSHARRVAPSTSGHHWSDVRPLD